MLMLMLKPMLNANCRPTANLLAGRESNAEYGVYYVDPTLPGEFQLLGQSMSFVTQYLQTGAIPAGKEHQACSTRPGLGGVVMVRP